jgi:hypothetical protein
MRGDVKHFDPVNSRAFPDLRTLDKEKPILAASIRSRLTVWHAFQSLCREMRSMVAHGSYP